uniref:hypothetical protein n=1 Tax=Gemmiger formicilis TaxID=745368 RepID=UPI003FEDA6C7
MPGPAVYGGRLLTGRPRAAHVRPLHGSNGFLNISARKKGMYDLSNRTCLFILYSFPQQEQHGQQ